MIYPYKIVIDELGIKALAELYGIDPTAVSAEILTLICLVDIMGKSIAIISIDRHPTPDPVPVLAS
jgi:hypothetical protein